MPERLLIDSGAFIALLDADDDLHLEAARFYQEVSSAVAQGIAAEVYTFLRYHHGRAVAMRWLDFLDRARASGHLALLCADAEDDRRATGLLRRFGDQALSYVDALTQGTLDRVSITTSLSRVGRYCPDRAVLTVARDPGAPERWERPVPPPIASKYLVAAGERVHATGVLPGLRACPQA